MEEKPVRFVAFPLLLLIICEVCMSLYNIPDPSEHTSRISLMIASLYQLTVLIIACVFFSIITPSIISSNFNSDHVGSITSIGVTFFRLNLGHCVMHHITVISTCIVLILKAFGVQLPNRHHRLKRLRKFVEYLLTANHRLPRTRIRIKGTFLPLKFDFLTNVRTKCLHSRVVFICLLQSRRFLPSFPLVQSHCVLLVVR